MPRLFVILIAYTSILVSAYGFDYGKKSSYLAPVREHAIIVAEEGYYPNKISLFEGEKLRVFLSTTEKSKGCMMIPEKKFFLSATPGNVNSAEIEFKSAGVYNFYCPTGKQLGKVTVLPKKTKKKERKPASVEKRVWMPRDE